MKKRTSFEKYQLIKPLIEKESSAIEIEKISGVPARTLRYWIAQFKISGLTSLERKQRSDKNNYRSLPADLVEITKGFALQKPRMPITSILRKVTIIAQKRNIKLPSYDTIYKIVKSISPALLTLAIDGSKVYQQKYELLFRRECKSSNEVWQADHTELDIFILDEKGFEARPWLTTIIDDYSRAIAGCFLSLSSPSSINTALALRQAIWKKKNQAWEVCGIPAVLYTDHGTDFMSQHIEQVCVNLKIRMVNSTVGKPQGRGKVERFFQTLNEKVLVDLPGYSVNGRPSSKPTLTIEQLDNIMEGFIVEAYNKEVHASTGEAPLKRWSYSFLPQLPESMERLDDLLLSITKPRKIQRDGIRFMRFRYISTTLAGFVGENVTLKYDPRDLAEIRVFYQERFLCKAICQDLAGLTIGVKEIKKARIDIKRGLYKEIKTLKVAIEDKPSKNSKKKNISSNTADLISPQKTKIKLYEND